MGQRKTRIWSIWHNMKTRCNNQYYDKYDRYGGRGIKVCDDWANSFELFKEWALENGYKEDLTLDRIDNDKGYNPDNCRWVSRKEQANNRSSNRFLEYNGETKTVSAWAEKLGLPSRTIFNRLSRGWSIEKTLTEPVHDTQKHVFFTYNGRTQRIFEWAKEFGIPYNTLHARISKGWDPEKALSTDYQKIK